jgi:hypothetical protein
MTDCPRQAPVTVTRSGAYWVLVPDVDGDVAVVNEAGYRVFTTCDGRRDCAAIAAGLAAETGIPADQVLADVLAYIVRLRAAGLLTAAGAA